MFFIFGIHEKLMAADDNMPILHVISGYENPYIHEKPNGEVVGVYMNSVRNYLDASGLSYNIELLSWPRASRQLNIRNDTVVFGLTRIPKREEKFHWLALLGEYKQYLITRNTPDMNLLTKEQILAGDFSAICTRDSATCAALVKFGFPKSRLILTSQVTAGEHVRMLLRERGDFILGDKIELKREMIDLDLSIDDITQLFYVETMQSYLAAPAHLNPILLEKLTHSNEQ